MWHLLSTIEARDQLALLEKHLTVCTGAVDCNPVLFFFGILSEHIQNVEDFCFLRLGRYVVAILKYHIVLSIAYPLKCHCLMVT